MPRPVSAPEMLALVRRSGLVPEAALDLLSADELDMASVLARLVEAGRLTRFQAEQLAAGRWKGFTLGPYRLLDRLGAGGMGTVYLAEHRSTADRVAVKVLNPRLASDPTSLARFAREAAAATRLSHPHVVPVTDLALDHSPPYLVMEHVDGLSLQAAVAAAGPFPPADAAHCGRQALLGLQHAHEAGLVHRDVKPANLMLDRAGVVRVLDLGVVRVAADDSITRPGGAERLILGTADYLAPEQAVDSHSVDTRADVYGLGATLYFLLAGHPPFGDVPSADKLAVKQACDPRPIESVRPDVPRGLAAVIRRMLARNPADRYPTPQAAADALAPFAVPTAGFPRQVFAGRSAAASNTPTAAGQVEETAAPTDVVRVVPLDGSDLHLPAGSLLTPPPTARFGVRPFPPAPSAPNRRLAVGVAGLLLLALASAGVGVALLRAAGLSVPQAITGRKL